MGDISKNTKELIDEWSSRGEVLEIKNTASTKIWREGSGPPVLCLHGVPSSAYLYRKMLPNFADQGLEGITLDFPGMGFADRPQDFDYSWTGLSEWLEKAINATNITQFHLVVHDIGGPIGFDLIRRNPDKILSLTVLDTFVYTSQFSKPWVMRPFSVPIIGKIWTLTMNTPLIYPFFRWKAVTSRPKYSEIRVYGKLISMKDGGKTFRKIMSNFENTMEFEERILSVFKNRKFPAQIIWGKYDKELPVDEYGIKIKEALNLKKDIYLVEGKHFIQEDQPEEIVERIKWLVEMGEDI